jgi:hypothetical protein
LHGPLLILLVAFLLLNLRNQHHRIVGSWIFRSTTILSRSSSGANMSAVRVRVLRQVQVVRH